MLELRITFDQEEPFHASVATAVSWNGTNEVLSAGDDHQVLRWDLLTHETSTAIDLPHDFYPISMKWPTESMGGGNRVPGRKTNELLLLTGSAGTFHLYGKGNRLEKTVQAHQGAVISGSWSPNGSEILTSGEDGFLRIWSRTGMLRSVLAQHHMTIYSSIWGPDGRSVLYGLDKNLIIRQTVAGSKPNEWKAHDGLILTVAWSPASNLIISGGEDCRYRVWHPDGRCVYTSPSLDFPITSAAWAPGGDLFCVGGSDMIRLCDRFGWTHSVENPKFGTVYSTEWSSDGTQFAGATSEGHVFVASVILKSCVWKNVEAILASPSTLHIFEFKANTKDELEFQERIIHFSMNYGHLIVVLQTQVYIYSLDNIPHHVVCDLKESNSIYLTLQSKRNFILCGHGGIASRAYDGRQLAQIKWPGMQNEMLNVRTTSLAEDMIALIDQSERRLIRVHDTHNGRLIHEERTTTEILEVGLAQNEMRGPTERQMAFIDKNGDLFLTILKRQGKAEVAKHLSTATVSILWHIEAPMLATVRENKVRIYYYPQILFLDETLLEDTVDEKDIGIVGHSPELLTYIESGIRLRKGDGTLICTNGNSFVAQLYQFMGDGNFVKARRLCRYVKDEKLWGVLAGLAMSRGELDIAEICFSEIGHFDKVEFLTGVKEIQDEVSQKAQKELFLGGLSKGEEVLMKAGRIGEAIKLNMDSMNWERALDLTLKHNEDPKIVYDRRQQFLENFNIEEFLPRFLELGDYLLKGQGRNKKHQNQPSPPKITEDIEEEIIEEEV